MSSPVFRAGDVAPHFSPGRYLTFEGFSVDEHGKQHFMDATVAYRQACLRTIEYLKRFGEFLPRGGKSANVRLLRGTNLPAAVLRSDSWMHRRHS